MLDNQPGGAGRGENGDMAASPQRPTLVTVARLAGVSVASASRVLSGGTATPSMQQRVRAAAAQLGYVPDSAARSLRGGRTGQLGLAVADVGNPTYIAMMRGIESVTSAAGYRLLIHSSGAETGDEIAMVNSLRNRFVDGLIICPIRVNDRLLRALADASAPVAVIGKLPEDALVDNVGTDSGLGIMLAAQHLLGTGRRKLALVNGPADTTPGASRLAGFQAVVAGAGLPAADREIESAADFTYAAGLEAARRLLDRFTPDAVLCSNDLLAFAVIRTLADQGLRVPDDVAVTGMDDTELTQMHLPSLTSVSLEAAARGQCAAHMLLERIDHPDLPPRREQMGPRLVIRESSLPAAGHPGRAAPALPGSGTVTEEQE
jgi:LacI family transcriptional regulator